MKQLFLFLLLTTSANAWNIKGLGEFSPQEISPNVFVIHGPAGVPSKENQGFMNNPGFIIGKSGVILIDPGSSFLVGKKVLKEIQKITKKPIVAVFNTHIHGDHWLGNQAISASFPKVKIYAHPEMIKQAKNGESERWIALMERLTAGISKGTKAVYPTDSTSHLQTLKIAHETFKIHAPLATAHTKTDIMIEHTNSKTIFLGDNSFIGRLGVFGADSDIHGNIKTLQYAKNLHLKNYVPGHGKSGSAKLSLQPFLDYLIILKSATQKGYDQDLADYEIKPSAIKFLKKYQNWHSFKTSIGPHINKMFLEIEARDL